MKKLLIVLIVLRVGIDVHVALAGENPSLLLEGGMSALLASRDTFFIEVVDEVSDGCLPQPSRLKDQTEIAIRQNNLSVSNESGIGSNVISLNAMGYDYGHNLCAVYFSATLQFWSLVVVPGAHEAPHGNYTFVPIAFRFESAILTGPKTSMQGRLEALARRYGESLFLHVSRARDEVSSKWPTITQK